VQLPVDLGSVLVDGRQHWFVAHLVARRSWWHGRVVAAMNAEFVGAWDLAPRSHPNDGRLDVLDADLGLRDRWKAWRRLPTGAHVPHPAIRVERSKAVQLDLVPPLDVWLDGVSLGTAHHLSIRVEPDALTVVV
jgi:diacylglycerol kinase family enzyme